MYNIYKGAGAYVTDDPVKIRLTQIQVAKKIKEQTDAETVEEPISPIIEQGKRQAEQLVEAASIEADKIIENARKSAEAEIAQKKQAFEKEMQIPLQQEREKAYELGLLEGIKQKSHDIETAINILNEEVTHLKAQTENEFTYQRETLVDLTMQVCEKILVKKIETDDAILIPIVSQALNDMRHDSHCTVTVSREAEPALKTLKDNLTAAKNFASDMFDIVAKDVPPDFCVVTTDENVLDYSVLNQFENLRNFMKQTEK